MSYPQPLRIHISEATAKLLEGTNFVVEDRGEVEVKVSPSDEHRRRKCQAQMLPIKPPLLSLSTQSWIQCAFAFNLLIVTVGLQDISGSNQKLHGNVRNVWMPVVCSCNDYTIQVVRRATSRTE